MRLLLSLLMLTMPLAIARTAKADRIGASESATPVEQPTSPTWTAVGLPVVPIGRASLRGDEWLATTQGSWLARIDASSTRLQRVGPEEGNSSLWVSPTGTIWIAAPELGLVRSTAAQTFASVAPGWDTYASNTLMAGRSDDDLWISSADGSLRHWNGRGLAVVRTPNDPRFTALHENHQKVYALDSTGKIYELRESGAIALPIPAAPPNQWALFVRSPREIYAGGARFDGRVWTIPLGPTGEPIFATQLILHQGSLHAAGPLGAFRWERGAWLRVSPAGVPLAGLASTPRGLRALTSSGAFAEIDQGTIEVLGSAALTLTPDHRSCVVDGALFSILTDTVAVLTQRGVRFSPSTSLPPGCAPVARVAIPAPDDTPALPEGETPASSIFARGSERFAFLRHSNDPSALRLAQAVNGAWETRIDRWEIARWPDSVTSLTGDARVGGDLWIGVGSAAFRLRGEELRRFTLPGEPGDMAIFANGGDIFAGGGGSLSRFERGAFRPIDTAVTATIAITHGSRTYLLGNNEVGELRSEPARASIYGSDGSALAALTGREFGPLLSAAQGASGDLYVVSHNNLLRFEGGRWRGLPHRGPAPIVRVASAGSHLYATDRAGALYAITDDELRSVARDGVAEATGLFVTRDGRVHAWSNNEAATFDGGRFQRWRERQRAALIELDGLGTVAIADDGVFARGRQGGEWGPAELTVAYADETRRHGPMPLGTPSAAVSLPDGRVALVGGYQGADLIVLDAAGGGHSVAIPITGADQLLLLDGELYVFGNDGAVLHAPVSAL